MRGKHLRGFAIAGVVALSALAFSSVAFAGFGRGNGTTIKEQQRSTIGALVPTGEKVSFKDTGQYFNWSLFYFWLRSYWYAR